MSALYMYDAAYAVPLASMHAKRAAAGSHYMTRSYAGTSLQPADLRTNGMGALHNWEGMAAELKGASRAKGRAVAEEALSAFSRGAPRDGTLSIAYSVDTDLTNLAACDNVFRGINDVHASSVGKGIRVMVYGEGGLLLRLHKLGLVQGKQWLSMSEGFGQFAAALASGVVGIVQSHNAAGQWIGTDIPGTDRNTILDPYNSGIWWPAGSPYLRKPTAPAPPVPAKPATPAAVTPTAPVPAPHPSEDLVAVIVKVDQKDCARQKVPWPGYYLDSGDGQPRYIGTLAELHARRAEGFPEKTLTLADARAIGVK